MGTIVLQGGAEDLTAALPGVVWDTRTKSWRAPGASYRDVIVAMQAKATPFKDEARAYEGVRFAPISSLTMRPHQEKALKAWMDHGRRGVVSLPTGAGKTILAVFAIAATSRPALVLVPTLDLMAQWAQVLGKFFEQEIGLVGGGSHDIRPLTVSTYDSAHIHAEKLGNRFGLLIADECHHLPAAQYQIIARASIAPFRLGLSATVERADGGEEILYDLMGPLVYAADIRDMVSNVLAPYDVVNVQVELTPQEQRAYAEARQKYVDFIRYQRINMGSPTGWQDFIIRCARSPDGPEAMRAYRAQKRLAQGAEGKLHELWRILKDHREDRVIIFTDDNDFAYRIGREFILPVLTHQTKIRERKALLAAFSSGEIGVLVTSKVLNEGVDVPEASVGVVVSGSGAVREHVQRLGRILRHRPGKRAILYELIAQNTNEYFVNQRRRQHHAYQGSPQIS